MARDVVPLRLSSDEKAAIERAARNRRLTLSEFLRQAALAVAYRLSETASSPREDGAEARPPDPPKRPDGRHVVTTYASFEEYQANSPYAWSGQQVIPPGGVMRKDN
jgi:hypothetical protein